jgi:hypothetical protein
MALFASSTRSSLMAHTWTQQYRGGTSAVLVFALFNLIWCSSFTSAQFQNIVCDGVERQIDMPAPPYPTSATGYAPITNQPDFTCSRADSNAGLECGARSNYTCESIVFAPITSSSGFLPTIIPPTNPIIYSLIPSSKYYFTHIEWTAVDIGTGGARLAGVYSNTSPLASVVQPYAWVPNGAIQVDNTTLYGVCTNCVLNAGIKVMSVSSTSGAGFRGMELSQLYTNVRCGASGVNFDGIYWTGMKYICVQVGASYRSLSA